MNRTLLSTTIELAINAAKGYRSAKRGIQAALGYALTQGLDHGNSDGLQSVFVAGGMLVALPQSAGVESPMYALQSDGKRMLAYLSEIGAPLFRFDSKRGRVAMAKGHSKVAEEIDRDELEYNLATTFWYQPASKKPRAATPVDIDKLIKAAVGKAMGANIAPSDIIGALRIMARDLAVELSIAEDARVAREAEAESRKGQREANLSAMAEAARRPSKAADIDPATLTPPPPAAGLAGLRDLLATASVH